MRSSSTFISHAVRVAGVAGLATLLVMPVWGAPVPASGGRNSGLVRRLDEIRTRIISLQKVLIDASRNQKHAKGNLKKIEALIRLQREERDLGKQRLTDLEGTVRELETRRASLNSKIVEQQKSVRRFLMAIERGTDEDPTRKVYAMPVLESERIEAPRRRILANLTSRGIREIEILKVDLADAENLETRIQEEKQQLAYLFQDLFEKESVLELNRQIQADMLQKNHEERVAQLENYRLLKSAEAQVESLIGEFNARIELERATEAERAASKAMNNGAFARLKGRLPLPVGGAKVLTAFGRAYDPKSRLYIFKKGVELSAGKNEPVRAISAGKVAFSGELPSYGKVAIIDHGEHFYSLCAQLGSLSKKAGEAVAAGEHIGVADDSGTPVYFEIRARNVAVNPLQWVAN